MITKVILIGAGHYAATVFCYLDKSPDHEVEAFAVDPEFIDTQTLCGRPVISLTELTDLYPPSSVEIFCAVGPQKMNLYRMTLYERIRQWGYRFLTYIDPKAGTWPDLVVGQNVFIDDTCTIQPYVTIGDNVTLLASIVGHHGHIQDHAFLSRATLGGSVEIGEGTFIGMNATIRDNTRVGSHCVVGMGAAVQQDIEDDTVVAAPKCRTVTLTKHRIQTIQSSSTRLVKGIANEHHTTDSSLYC